MLSAVWVAGELGLLLSTICAFFTLCRFMEFEAEEEMQIQNAQLMNGSQGLAPGTPLKLDPGPLVPEACQQPGKASPKPEEGEERHCFLLLRHSCPEVTFYEPNRMPYRKLGS